MWVKPFADEEIQLGIGNLSTATSSGSLTVGLKPKQSAYKVHAVGMDMLMMIDNNN